MRVVRLTGRAVLAATGARLAVETGLGEGVISVTGAGLGATVPFGTELVGAAAADCSVFDSVNACSVTPELLMNSASSLAGVMVRRTAPKWALSCHTLPAIGGPIG